MNATIRQKWMDAKAKRAEFIQQAEEAISHDIEKYKDLMAQAQAINPEIEAYETLLAEESRFAGKDFQNPDTGEEAEKAMERAETLRKGGKVSFSVDEVLVEMGLAPMKSTTLATGTLVEPTRISTTIRDNVDRVSSIVDQVFVQNLTGCQAILEPMLMADMEAKKGKVTALAGTTRAESDPTWDSAKIAPYEVNVTSFVDRNLARLTPVAYEAKIRSIAMRALRRAVAGLIFNGDGQSSPDMYGIKNAKSTGGVNLFKQVTVGDFEAGILDDLVFAYGGDNELGGTARLFCAKEDLKSLGAIRSNDGKRIYEIIPDAANPNVGRITDGGLIVPYTITSDLTPHTTGSGQTMVYGNPMNYELGLFGDYSIRIDESVKAVERMNAILGDVFVGGNLIAQHGFVVATKG